MNLTPEEVRVLKECSKEGIIRRAIPMGISFGLGGYMLAQSGKLNHKRFGAKPAVLGFGILGYMIGRYTYMKVCFEKLYQIPDGNLRKMLPRDPNVYGYK